MSDHPRTILVTSALPYANGSIHLGHLVEYIQTDIWVRFQRLRGHSCLYVCADDCHGTPIMLRAEQDGITPEELISRIGEEHRADFRDFAIGFDNFYTTHSEENQEFANLIYERLRDAGHIVQRTIREPYDAVKGVGLPDRYIRGTCPNPRCGAPDQYGDSCEVCSTTYRSSDLIEPLSVLSGQPPLWRDSEHYFVRLADFTEMLKGWVGAADGPARVQPEIANKLEEWFGVGLQDWDISRDAPYFGFEIPDAPGKFFYVWLDAPIGYMASFKNLCKRRSDLDFDAYWGPQSGAELYHFIGKDIAYFHTLFWPANLHGAGFRTPTAVFCHGFLTVNGRKMSKTRGTFINARTYLDHLNPEYLRYYFAGKLGSGIDDLDLNLDDFVQRVNSDLVGKLVNIASRCAGFIAKGFDGRMAETLADPDLYARFVSAGDEIARYYEDREFAKAVRAIMALADVANQYIDEHKPWVLVKQESNEARVQAVCTMGLNLFRVLMIYLKPVMPMMAARAEGFLDSEIASWSDAHEPLLDHRIKGFQKLMTRVERERVDAMLDDARETLGVTTPGESKVKDVEPIADEIDIDAFMKIDLRIARITAAERVDGADKLLALTVDVGVESRTIFAGVKAAYDPQALVGRLTVVVANLKHRKMRFGTSQGMVLAAGPGGEDIWLLGVDEGAEPGMRVK
ncbi:MAG: methionine--tRNA ligase [Gammaproteobacteria bacterium]|nr:methionine--tRNA ligase [Gammaproteobacteria bacterium]MDX2460174.1 methionine--tRNA ligase [Gammaproteobacteria bacterium]